MFTFVTNGDGAEASEEAFQVTGQVTGDRGYLIEN